MSAIDPKVLSKIKKCLALASSDNPHEAAAAMRQAKALMDKNGVSASHIAMSEVGEATAKSTTMARNKPAAWEVSLAVKVGKAFGCQLMFKRVASEVGRPANDGAYIFVGLKQQAEVASYTAHVLIRKCKKARADFIDTHLKGMSGLGPGLKKKTTGMANAFAEGWVYSISKLVMDFANPPGIDEAITQRIKDSQTSDKNAPFREAEHNDRDAQLAALAGVRAAKGESLYRPMAKNGDALMIGN